MHRHSVPIKTVGMWYNLISRNWGNYQIGNLEHFKHYALCGYCGLDRIDSAFTLCALLHSGGDLMFLCASASREETY